MSGLPALIAALVPASDGALSVAIPDNWLQGRTCYGGLSAALALHAAKRVAPDLPPLRSAQVAFVGPLSGTVRVRARLLRRGRNAAFVHAAIESEAGLGLSATFVFMRVADSHIDHAVAAPAPVPAPGSGDVVTGGLPAVAFTQNFEFVDHPAAPAEWLRWVRLTDRAGLDPEVELMAIGDCLPPAALKLADRLIPLSSLTWQLDLLAAAPVSADGWWLLQATTDHARHGGSSQRMAIWNAAGDPVAAQMQSVALFG
ncbi:thioesterase family protein [Sphingomonas sp. KR1UV-12]|uniref:Thioesterase family protein n=1 Tax=Sphingomonas aurea TaxID=3063994 RepID=A0ABT9EIV6_9SPHN|nr:acyl-CoA thioesterase domain-containing protein [Sphingomonas sp. KR1UV-12]MDP1026558.1 thioesterase family protein [Sphingomonas sp. KR1UV-12]